MSIFNIHKYCTIDNILVQLWLRSSAFFPDLSALEYCKGSAAASVNAQRKSNYLHEGLLIIRQIPGELNDTNICTKNTQRKVQKTCTKNCW